MYVSSFRSTMSNLSTLYAFGQNLMVSWRHRPSLFVEFKVLLKHSITPEEAFC
jgi:hypothetical protein